MADTTDLMSKYTNELEPKADTVNAMDALMERDRQERDGSRQRLESDFHERLVEKDGMFVRKEDVELEETRPYLEELERRYPDSSPPKVIEEYLHWHEQILTDPVRGAERFAQEYARRGKMGGVKSVEPKKIEGFGGEIGHKLPDGSVRYAQEDSPREAVVQAMASHQRKARDSEALQRARQTIAKQFPQRKLKDVVKLIVDMDERASQNPTLAAAWWATANGASLVEGEAQQFHAQNEAKQRWLSGFHQAVANEYRHLVPHEKEIEQMVKAGEIRSHPDPRVFLQNAERTLRAKYRDKQIAAEQQRRANATPKSDSVSDLVNAAWHQHTR